MIESLLCLLGFMLGCLLFSMRTEGNKKANTLLAALLFLEASFSFVLSFDQSHLVGEITVTTTIMLSRLLHGPILYHYVKEILGFQFRLDRRTVLHLIPFIAVSVFLLAYTPSNAGRPHAWWTQVKFDTSADVLFSATVAAMTVFSCAAYAIAALKLIHAYRHRLKNQYSSYQMVSLHWLKSLCWLQLFLAACGAVFFGIFPLVPSLEHLPLDLTRFVVMSSTLWFFFIVFYGFKQPAVFHPPLETASKPEAETADDILLGTGGKTRQCTMEDSEARHYYQLLVEQVEENQLYLDSALKIAKLSDCLGLTIPQISYIINHCAEKNFYEFINSYRIDYAQQLASKCITDGRRISPADMAEQSGYNTATTFYKHFKIYTGKTPRAYISELKADKYSNTPHEV